MNNRAGYVDQLTNRCDRAAISKIRLTAHELAIEKNKIVEHTYREERFCHICKKNTLIEDEEHFLLIIFKS